MKRGDWARQFANALGNAEPSEHIIRWISAWTACEGTPAQYNPLASSHKTEGDSDFNGIVRNYPDHLTGLKMTVETINGRHTGYADIREGIRLNNVRMAQKGLYASPWGTSGTCVDLKYANPLNTNLTEEFLDSHPDGSASGGDWSVDEPIISLPSVDDLVSDATGLPSQEEIAGYKRRAIYIIAGSALLIVGTVLAVRSLVPTEQIVRTIAAAA